MSKQTKITKSARCQECQVRIAGICNFNPETTVLAHLNGGGMGSKRLDVHAAYACSDCHDYLDGGYSYVKGHTRDMRDLSHLQAMVRTQVLLHEQGLISFD